MGKNKQTNEQFKDTTTPSHTHTLVVRRGKAAETSNRITRPNTAKVPVPVRSPARMHTLKFISGIRNQWKIILKKSFDFAHIIGNFLYGTFLGHGCIHVWVCSCMMCVCVPGRSPARVHSSHLWVYIACVSMLMHDKTLLTGTVDMPILRRSVNLYLDLSRVSISCPSTLIM